MNAQTLAFSPCLEAPVFGAVADVDEGWNMATQVGQPMHLDGRPGLQLLAAELAAVKNGRVFQLRGMKRTGCGEVFGFGNKSAKV